MIIIKHITGKKIILILSVFLFGCGNSSNNLIESDCLTTKRVLKLKSFSTEEKYEYKFSNKIYKGVSCKVVSESKILFGYQEKEIKVLIYKEKEGNDYLISIELFSDIEIVPLKGYENLKFEGLTTHNGQVDIFFFDDNNYYILRFLKNEDNIQIESFDNW